MNKSPLTLLGGRKLFSSLVFLTILVFSTAKITYANAEKSPSISGLVQDESGTPISGAQVSLWQTKSLVEQTKTDEVGRFDISNLAEGSYDVIVFMDHKNTPGFDYLPSLVKATTSEQRELTFTLKPAASVILKGDIQFFESQDLSRTTSYLVIEPKSEEVITNDGFTLIFSGVNSDESFLDLDPGHIIIPAFLPVKIGVNSSVLVGSELKDKYFEVDEPNHIVLQKGDLTTYDIRMFSIPFNLEIYDNLNKELESILKEMESMGFYLTPQRKAVASASRLWSEAIYFFDTDRYVESFDSGKKGFIRLSHTQEELNKMRTDASFSVYIIIVLLAFSSSTIAFLLSNNDTTKLIGSIAIFALSITILYITYPGSLMVPPTVFLGTSGIVLVASLTVAMTTPRFLKGRSGNGHVPLRNILVPIFSISKRSISRRRLRFVFTLASVTVLVMSFVALTSFSEGYGIRVNKISNKKMPLKGILIRASGYTQDEPVFLSYIDINSGWLDRQEESVIISAKVENRPQLLPIYTLNEQPIFGIVGIDHKVETQITGLNKALISGNLPTDGGLVLSETLKERLEVDLGEIIYLGGQVFKLDGILDDNVLKGLKDLDGSPYLPGKMVNPIPEGEEPLFTYQTCNPSEVLFIHISQAADLPLIGISRVNVVVADDFNAVSFAERLALERGYWTWASTDEGIQFASMGSYFEGKGLPLIVPWGIVVLNVVVTILNSMYERKKEIHILSSVGLNPAQIAGIFFAEASIIGLTAGGLGYLAGLILYKGMAVLQFSLDVHQKVSAFWSLASICLAMTAVFTGAFTALKGSIVITPSLTRRWKMDRDMVDFSEPWEITIPVKLMPEEMRSLFDFIVDEIRKLGNHPIMNTSYIKVIDDEEESLKINFVYKETQAPIGNFYTKNTFIIERNPSDGSVSVRLMSHGDQSCSHETGSLIRMMAMRWSTSRQRGELTTDSAGY